MYNLIELDILMMMNEKSRGKFDIFMVGQDGDLSNMIYASNQLEIVKRIQQMKELILQRLEPSNLQKIFGEVLDKKMSLMVQTINTIMVRLQDISHDTHAQHQQSGEDHSNSKIDLDKENSFNYSDMRENFEEQYENIKTMQMNEEEEEERDDYSILNMMNEQVYYRPNEIFSNPDTLLRSLKDKFQEMSLKFTKCELKYDFQEMKDINFHEKIDRKNDLFFMAELQNGEIIGAFTHLCFDPQPNLIPKQNSKSFICNLNKKVFVYAYKINRTHTYDRDYLIFGNWEIKVKAGEDILFTNWGSNGDCYLRKYYGKQQKTNVKLQWLFGNGASKKTMKMRQYQIFVFS